MPELKPCRKVKITKCSYPQAWYNDSIGEVFTVYQTIFGKDYILKEDYDMGHNTLWRHIDIKDCEVWNQRSEGE